MPQDLQRLADLIFALPAGSNLVSGGNIYNERLIAALRALLPVDSVSIDACRARVQRGEVGRYCIDSLNLREFLEFPARRPGQSFTLIVHHLPSLEHDHARHDDGLQVEQMALARFDFFLATSPFTAAYLVARGCTAERIMTVPPAPPAVAKAMPQRQYEPPLRALMVGNLIPRKAPLELLAALDARVAPTDDFFIDVVGRTDLDPDYAHRCRDLATNSERLAPIVRYRGIVPPGEMPVHYEAAHVFVSAARIETFGMALQEARGHGLPILALDGGYVRHHFTDGDDGLLFFSLDDLADGLLSLVRDGGRARALFARAQDRRTRTAGDDADYDWRDAARLFLRQLAAAQKC